MMDRRKFIRLLAVTGGTIAMGLALPSVEPASAQQIIFEWRVREEDWPMFLKALVRQDARERLTRRYRYA